MRKFRAHCWLGLGRFWDNLLEACDSTRLWLRGILKSDTRTRRAILALALETLEDRTLLSGSALSDLSPFPKFLPL